MSRTNKKAFMFSLVAHAAVFLGLVFTTLFSNCSQKEPELHVFELVPLPLSQADSIQPAAAPKTKTQPAETRKPDPEPTKPKTKPAIKPPTKPKTKPATKPPTKPKTKPARKPNPTPTQKNYRDFLKENPNLKTQPQTSTNTPRESTPPPPMIGGIEMKPAKPTPRVNNSSELDAYKFRVGQMILSKYLELERNANLQNNGSSAKVFVKFRVTPAGRLVSPELKQKSSNAAFNSLILQALQQVGNVGPPPPSTPSFLSMSFNMP
ncbi:MAG: hypothetical protein CMI30_12110 [Opitutae bacterium]|nr:hypothetical protein [Opitutae bacterium]